MDKPYGRRSMLIVFFGTIGLLFSGFVYYLLVGKADPAYTRRRPPEAASARAAPASLSAEATSLTLMLDQTLRVGSILLVYRGTDDGRIRLGVIVPALDPEYTYLHNLSISEAKQGFQVAEQQFELLAVSAATLRLKRRPPFRPPP
jgi:hypothetical protein